MERETRPGSSPLTATCIPLPRGPSPTALEPKGEASCHPVLHEGNSAVGVSVPSPHPRIKPGGLSAYHAQFWAPQRPPCSEPPSGRCAVDTGILAARVSLHSALCGRPRRHHSQTLCQSWKEEGVGGRVGAPEPTPQHTHAVSCPALLQRTWRAWA